MKEQKKEIQKVKIVQMDKHFLYLSLYYAQHCNFFGYLPQNYEIEIYNLGKFEHTDENAFKALMREPYEKKGIHYAICDPVQVLNTTHISSDYKPVILGSLITNSSFWAIDHYTHTTKAFKDLALYDKIITYPIGTTSYNIAEQLFAVSGKKCKKEEFIKTVQPNYELLELRESPAGTIALSPNPFEIHELISNDESFKINLPLGSTPEYSNVLVTALLSRHEFVNNHRELTIGLLKALQRATALIKHYDENDSESTQLLPFVDRYFTDGKNASGALDMALNAKVFPDTVEINQLQWQKAVRAWNFHSDVSESDQLAETSYDNYIRPFLHFANEAYTEVMIKPILPEKNIFKKNKNRSFVVISSIGCFLTLVIVYYFSSLEFLIQNLVISVVALLYIIATNFLFISDDKKIHWMIHNILVLSAFCYILFIVNGSPEMVNRWISGTVLSGLAIADLNLIRERISSKK